MNRFPKINAHALGACKGRIYTNSLEAFETSYRAGCRSFEADVNLTKDGAFVISHDIRRLMRQTYCEFMNDKTVGVHDEWDGVAIQGGTPLDMDAIFKLMAKYQDVFLMFDFQPSAIGPYAGRVDVLRDFCSLFCDEDIRKRCVIEISRNDWLVKIVGSYGLNSMLWVDGQNIDKVFQFIENYNVRYVSVAWNMLSKKIVNEFHKKGVVVYASGADRYVNYLQGRDMGCDFITTFFPYRYRNIMTFSFGFFLRKILMAMTLGRIARAFNFEFEQFSKRCL